MTEAILKFNLAWSRTYWIFSIKWRLNLFCKIHFLNSVTHLCGKKVLISQLQKFFAVDCTLLKIKNNKIKFLCNFCSWILLSNINENNDFRKRLWHKKWKPKIKSILFSDYFQESNNFFPILWIHWKKNATQVSN